jgi:hypothetical protein
VQCQDIGNRLCQDMGNRPSHSEGRVRTGERADVREPGPHRFVSDVLVQHSSRSPSWHPLRALTSWTVRYRQSPRAPASCQPFRLRSRRRPARSTCSGIHVPLLLTPSSLPLPSSLTKPPDLSSSGLHL